MTTSWLDSKLTNLTGDVIGPAPSRPVLRPTIRPFVLHCENCIAPVSEGQTTCTFCSAPLTWQPVASLSRDDYWFQQENAQHALDDEGLTPIGLGPVTVNCYSTMVLTVHPQAPLRVVRIYVPPECASAFSLKDFRVGNRSQFMGPDPIPASACAIGRGLRIFGAGSDTAVMGVNLSLAVWNQTLMTQRFQGILHCKVLDTFDPAMARSLPPSLSSGLPPHARARRR